MEGNVLHDQLRAWARGMTTLTAATELLIRTGYAREHSPWVHLEDGERPWIDFQSIPENVGGLSGGQQRVLRIAASIAADVPIVLGDEITGLDYEHAQLVFAALAQAAGYSEPVRSIDVVDEKPAFVDKAAIMTWPPA